MLKYFFSLFFLVINILFKINWYLQWPIPPSLATLKVLFWYVRLLWCFFTKLSYSVFCTSVTIFGACMIFSCTLFSTWSPKYIGIVPFMACRLNLITVPPIYTVGSIWYFNLVGSMLRNQFGSHVPNDLLLLEDACK